MGKDKVSSKSTVSKSSKVSKEKEAARGSSKRNAPSSKKKDPTESVLEVSFRDDTPIPIGPYGVSADLLTFQSRIDDIPSVWAAGGVDPEWFNSTVHERGVDPRPTLWDYCLEYGRTAFQLATAYDLPLTQIKVFDRRTREREHLTTLPNPSTLQPRFHFTSWVERPRSAGGMLHGSRSCDLHYNWSIPDETATWFKHSFESKIASAPPDINANGLEGVVDTHKTAAVQAKEACDLTTLEIRSHKANQPLAWGQRPATATTPTAPPDWNRGQPPPQRTLHWSVTQSGLE